MHTGAPGADKVRKRTSFHSQILFFHSQCFNFFHAFAGRNFPSEGVEGTARK